MKLRIGLTFLLLLVATAAGAEPSLYASATANHTDMSITYLGMIFGQVGNVLDGSSGQMFGHLMKEFNKGVIAVAGIILGYNAVVTVLRFTTEGTLMSANRNTYMILFRITFGFALLIPSPQTGYNMVQRVLLTVVTHSVTFGDMIWSTALEQVERDGVWHQPQASHDASGGDGSPFSDDFAKTALSSVAYSAKISSVSSMPTTNEKFESDFEAQEKARYGESVGSYGDEPLTAIPEILFAHSLCTYVESIKNNDPGLQASLYNPISNGTQANSQWEIQFPSSSTQPSGCGSVDVEKIATKIYDQPKPTDTQLLRTSNMLYSMAANYELAGKEYVCANKNDLDLSNSNHLSCYNLPVVLDSIPQWVQSLGTASKNNFQQLTQMVKENMELQQSGFTGDQKNYVKQAKSEGWIMAGAYYWGLAHLQTKHTNALKYDKRAFESPLDSFSTSGFELTSAMKTNIRKGSYYGYWLAYQEAKAKDASSAGGADGKVTADVTYSGPNFGAASIILGPLFGGFFGDVAKLMDKFDNNAYFALRDVNYGKLALCGLENYGSAAAAGAGAPGATYTPPECNSSAQKAGLVGGFNSTNGMGSDPILWLSQIGNLCISIAGNLFFTALLSSFAVGLLFIAMKPCVDFGPSFDSAFKWMKPVIISGAALFLTVGVLLSFMVPLYPFLVYVFAVIGWFILVIEAVVAMPLVALGVTHPEGHDILGKGEQALMIILGVFLRPALMVMGLIAGMIVSYVGLRVLILGYSTFLVDLFNPMSATTSSKASYGNIRAAAGIATGNLLLQGSSLWGGILKAIITYPVLLFIFASLAYQMVIASFSLIFALPDFVLRWIGGPQQPGVVNPAEIVQGMKSHLQGGMQQMGRLGTEAAQNYIRRRPSDSGKAGGTSTPDSNTSGGGQGGKGGAD